VLYEYILFPGAGRGGEDGGEYGSEVAVLPAMSNLRLGFEKSWLSSTESTFTITAVF
jgi:hypothetical protein